MMCLFLFLLICLACAGQARRVHLASQKLQGNSAIPVESLAKLLQATSPTAGWQVAGTQKGAGLAVNQPRGNLARSRLAPVMQNSENTLSADEVVEIDRSKPMTMDEVGDIDPQAALGKMGTLAKEIQEFAANGKTMDVKARNDRMDELSKELVRIFIPAIALALTQFSVFTLLLALIFGTLKRTHTGYTQLLALTAGIPVLSDALSNVSPGLGNGAISFVLADIADVVWIPFALSLTPKTVDYLSQRLRSWNLDPDSFRQQMRQMLDSAAQR